MSRRVELVAGVDELGEPEEFTFDLFPIVDPRATVHLRADGLPRIGTRIVPGMIIVGKIGKTRDYDASRQPSSLEVHGLPLDEVRARYGKMWRDSSLYADTETAGVVEEAGIQNVQGKQVAVVLIGG